jgi:hypothetical protein
MELPLRKACQLDDELDYQVPLAPSQVGEAAVEIARGGRFHGDSLTPVFLPSWALDARGCTIWQWVFSPRWLRVCVRQNAAHGL